MTSDKLQIVDFVRKLIVELSYRHKAHHVGSSLSCVEILIAILQKKSLQDSMILSKGHASMAYYSVLAALGKIAPEQLLESYLQSNSIYSGHPVKNQDLNVELTTGALGHGVLFGVGRAYQNKYVLKNSHKVFVVISDGELNCGKVWEGLMFGSHHKLNNFFVFIDNNQIQATDFASSVIDLPDLRSRFESFGFSYNQVDGHDIYEIDNLLNSLPSNQRRPTIIDAITVKGKGVPEIEGKVSSHYVVIDQSLYQKYGGLS